MQMIPTIDITPLREDSHPQHQQTVAAILAAAEDIGFLSITGTGVAQETVEAVRNAVRAIFAVDEKSKWDQAITRENYRGYIPMGFFTPNDGSGTADKYEGYKLHHEVAAGDPIRAACPLYGPNRWPLEVPEAREVILGYWSQLDGVFHLLLGALAEGLGLDPAAFQDPFEKPLTNMSLLHYPPQAPEEEGFGIHPHKDTDALTIIAPDPVGGLEVQTRDGGWITPDCPPGGFVVNIGDMLELWSGGRLVSTPHRVVNKSGRERYSFPYFAVPRHDVVVQPLLPPVEGFDRPSVHCGHWSAEIWRTNWPDENAGEDTPELGTIHS
ncbi:MULTISPECIES: isopenicillin N synthase family dioxygenase [unclassified Leisingera]|uniref:isopenicillin N synthase family dioxygenase n=1 Tax=unclassified Leisingera TaxID=2614906 RepID=UPI0002E6EE39|nr:MULTISPECIES: 2OG-Fe(II) oxygenase family protein [unclassified Leisingera]KIC25693.1 flavonol synthase [Leisingera sp. ANG-S3]KIC54203.1 flavonol synthase [Leisingera sp. ANG-S]KID10976.1 flavonol synthase [Leisingera sp. ANG1]